MSVDASRGALSVALLLLQGVVQCAVLEASRRDETFDGLQIVVVVELLKVCISLPFALIWECKILSTTYGMKYVMSTFSSSIGWMAVPGFLFVVQNNLVFLAASQLPASIIQVLQQVKLVWTAVFSYFVLGSSLSRHQWGALAALMVGAALVQFDVSSRSATLERHTSASVHIDARTANLEEASHVQRSDESIGSKGGELDAQVARIHGQSVAVIGLAASLGSSCLSGFNGVFLEAMLKHGAPCGRRSGGSTTGAGSPKGIRTSTEPASVHAPRAGVWARNVQLSVYGIMFGLVAIAIRTARREQIDQSDPGWPGDSATASSSAAASSGSSGIWKGSLLSRVIGEVVAHIQGMSAIAWAFVLLLALGGILVSLVTRYTSSMAKNMATTGSTVLGVTAVQYMRGEWPSGSFVLGVAAVLAGSLWYKLGARKSLAAISASEGLQDGERRQKERKCKGGEQRGRSSAGTHLSRRAVGGSKTETTEKWGSRRRRRSRVGN